MKTLYESILDIDTPSRWENDVKVGIKRQKHIQDVLKPIEDIIKMYHYSTQSIRTNNTDIYGLSGNVYWYEFTSTGKLAQDKKGVGVLQSILKQDYRKYRPKNINDSNSPVFPMSQFIFEDLGMSIVIFVVDHTGVNIRLCYQSDNKQTGKYIQDLVDKYTEPF